MRVALEFQRRIPHSDAAILHYDHSLYGDDPISAARNFARIVSGLGKRPAIVFLHEGLPALPRRPLFKPWSSAFLPTWKGHLARRTMTHAINSGKSLTALVHSEHMRREWIGVGALPSRVKAIVYPMRPAESLVEPRSLSDADKVELTIFGFVTEYKGYEIALNAMRLLPESYVLNIAGGCVPSSHNDRTLDAIHGFIQTGRWPYRLQYEPIATIRRRYSEAERQSMEKRVKFTGHVPPECVADIMGRTDIALVPYRRSCGSAVLADALEFARPTIAAALPVFCDLERRANCLRLVAPDAPFELAHAIRELAGNLVERRRMFSAARLFAETYSFAVLASDCLSLLASPAKGQSDVTHDYALAKRAIWGQN